jgi:hypothetical protein
LSAGRTRIGAWFAGMQDRLVAVDVEGTVAYIASDDVEALQSAVPSGGVRLRRDHELTVTWHADQPPPDAAIEREVSRLSDLLCHYLQLRLVRE